MWSRCGGGGLIPCRLALAEWRNGKRAGLKNLWMKVLVGSTPTSATNLKIPPGIFRSNNLLYIWQALVAQRQRQFPFKLRVGGSSPPRGT